MSLETLIDDSRHAIEADPIKAKAVFAIHGDLVVLTEVDLHARGHAVKVDEPPSLGGEELRRLIGPVPQLVLFEIVPRPWAPIEPRARGNRLLLSGGLAAPAENPCKKQVPEEGLEPPTRDVIRVLEAHGWRLERQRGSHRIFRHETRPGTVTVAGKPNTDIPPGTLGSIRRQSGLEDELR